MKKYLLIIYRTLRRWKYQCDPLRLIRQYKLKKARKDNRPFVARMPGVNQKMIVHPKMYLSRAYSGEIFEPGSIHFIKTNVKEGMVVLDIGANVGYFTLLFSHLVGQVGKVIAFEPSQKSFEMLSENLEINAFTNVVACQKAVSDVSGEISFYEGPEGYDVYNSIYEIKHPSAQNVCFKKNIVKATTIDCELKKLEIDRIDFVKIDVEGAELNVIKGMRETLKSNSCVTLLFECADIITDGSSRYDLINEVERMGFTCWKIDHKGSRVEIESPKSSSLQMIAAMK